MTRSGPPAAPPVVVNGWSIYAHPIFLDQLDTLIGEVEERRARDPETYRQKNAFKRLAAIFKIVFQTIPADPGGPQFRQGKTLGDGRKHWFRAKFLQQYRLFFRFDGAAKIVVLAWVNDESSLRAYGSKDDAYATFRAMLDSGHPPDVYDALLKEAKAASSRFEASFEAAGQS
ncbi:hypothetical protein GCM10011390_48090 [Aureimonas endophytica]|uniref:Toxin YhaV n=1 Tax=Aureimonas endophytica TaxID=2027858 RepID=A0A917A229_9HYPH|nr:type II toxin-antitoxin system YhaV family toxin [Aureimonas endophytica]GGE23041.1 hypothetical protein GCM10011390_48090 [Aureimonas endophytica]